LIGHAHTVARHLDLSFERLIETLAAGLPSIGAA
jgi:hypothetical protein